MKFLSLVTQRAFRTVQVALYKIFSPLDPQLTLPALDPLPRQGKYQQRLDPPLSLDNTLETTLRRLILGQLSERCVRMWPQRPNLYYEPVYKQVPGKQEQNLAQLQLALRRLFQLA
jgi:hypothetical protein